MSNHLLAIDLVACAVVTLTAGWLVTEGLLSRVARFACGLVACGGCVNTIGIYGMVESLDGFFYGDVWPSEVIVDVGMAVLMVRWAVRLHGAPAESPCP